MEEEKKEHDPSHELFYAHSQNYHPRIINLYREYPLKQGIVYCIPCYIYILGVLFSTYIYCS